LQLICTHRFGALGADVQCTSCTSGSRGTETMVTYELRFRRRVEKSRSTRIGYYARTHGPRRLLAMGRGNRGNRSDTLAVDNTIWRSREKKIQENANYNIIRTSLSIVAPGARLKTEFFARSQRTVTIYYFTMTYTIRTHKSYILLSFQEPDRGGGGALAVTEINVAR